MARESTTQENRKHFKRFIIGALVMVGGLISILLLNIYSLPSLKQEWLAFAALAISALGGMLALIGYLGLLKSRIKHFLEN
ncbi:hypothetical protein OLMES_1962 [Oleiphilus messinensis]|uniref:Uncharacterized protein n=1 Tax=Oleiphilus messinensis TaxID=141451 RepID=A0A1Y0I8E1_9GAMM|nr:hypothetical protein [Oleiphilus messinensis]ARU56036.1 hypothetical protein OLMES_1962 [Oleiphilus messinensis]